MWLGESLHIDVRQNDSSVSSFSNPLNQLRRVVTKGREGTESRVRVDHDGPEGIFAERELRTRVLDGDPLGVDSVDRARTC